jgi:lipoprotein-anchoring transpeptidase ErfK/SrfK
MTRRGAAAGLPAVAVAVAVLAGACGGSSGSTPVEAAGSGVFQVAPGSAPTDVLRETTTAPAPSPAQPRAPVFVSAHLPRGGVLYAQPGGRRIASLARTTSFGSPQVLAVVKRRGAWLNVISSELPNNRTGWVRAQGTRLTETTWQLRLDRSDRRLTALKGGTVVLRTRVAVGRPDTPTPLGTFAVTDRLRLKRYSPYGCCVLALSGKQETELQNWSGGDRLALHATTDESLIGQAVSHGCIRAPTDVMKRLLREIPLGTRMVVRE